VSGESLLSMLVEWGGDKGKGRKEGVMSKRGEGRGILGIIGFLFAS
jgi:hypothetical protein